MNLSVTEAPSRILRSIRIEYVDVLRGLIMVMMTLDYTRFFFTPRPIPRKSWIL